MNSIINNIRRELKRNSDPKTKKSNRRFFKEKIKLYGVKTPVAIKIGKAFLKEIEGQKKTEVFDLCEEFWRSGYLEESFIACLWAYSVRKDFRPEDFKVFEKWVNKFVGNWASCDTLCNHTIGAFMEMYPEQVPGLKDWAASKNLWVRRASAVSLIVPAKQGKFLKDILEIADILLLDQDDLVQKGYGWLLKAASHKHRKEIFDYIMKKKAIMPRTALRYAIEKIPKGLRKKAMEKEKED
jgi:3-methyladenine DNA glycosylase AlkD